MELSAQEIVFQHTAARRRLGFKARFNLLFLRFNTQPPEGGWAGKRPENTLNKVSTHSRPKAAGSRRSWRWRKCSRFNTQPPEGGWIHLI